MRIKQELYKVKILTCIVVVLIIGAAYSIAGYLRYPEDILRVSFFALLGLAVSLPCFFILINSDFRGSQFLFVILLVLSFALVLTTKYYDYSLIPYIGLFSLFNVISDDDISIISILSIILLLSIYTDAYIYLLIYVPAIIVLGKFLKESEYTVIVMPVLSAVFIVAFLYVTYILAAIDNIKPSDIVYPVMGLLLSIIISLVTLMTYRRHMLNKYEDITAKINDPEYYLMLELKAKSPEEYKLAIHTAYLCDRICSLLDYDRVLGKCLGYYHRIGIIREGRISDNTVKIALENNFPPPLYKELENYSTTGKKYPHSDELSVLVHCYEVIRSILSYNKKFPDRTPDYDNIIDKVFEVMNVNDTLKFSKMQLSDHYRMKQYLKDEKLYYDFLR